MSKKKENYNDLPDRGFIVPSRIGDHMKILRTRASIRGNMQDSWRGLERISCKSITKSNGW